MLIKGEEAKLILNFLLENYEGEGRFNNNPVSGYFKEWDIFTCFDNIGFSCYVEQAKTEEQAIQWCLREIDTTELYFSS